MANQITLEGFYSLNPGVDAAFSNLWLDTYSYAKPVDNIQA